MPPPAKSQKKAGDNVAERRMFHKNVVESDAFLDMATSAQALYFHLGMHADDDGFVNGPKRIVRLVGASIEDLRLLIDKRFLLEFENGVVVVKHWRMANSLKNDRAKMPQYGAAIACPNCGAVMVKPANRECANCGRFREGDGCGVFVDNCMTDYDAYSNWIPKGG